MDVDDGDDADDAEDAEDADDADDEYESDQCIESQRGTRPSEHDSSLYELISLSSGHREYSTNISC